MEVILLFILSGAIGWGLSALLLLAFLHALGHAVANSMGLPPGAKPGLEAPSMALATFRPSAEPHQLAPGGEILATGQKRRDGERREQAPAA